MKGAADMRSGMVIRLDGELYRVIHAEYHAGGGKMHGAMHAKLRGVQSDRTIDRKFRQEERFEEVELEYQAMEFLYEDGDFCVFMHPESYEQLTLPKDSLGPYLPYMEPNQTVKVELLDGAPLQVSYPSTVELRVELTPEPLHMDDSSVPKDATLANGMEIQVPQYVKEGDTVRIDVETGRFIERVR
jgi:elongation factor P